MRPGAESLQQMLTRLTGCDDERVERATTDIEEAVTYYKAVRKGVVDNDGRRVGKRASETRRQLRELRKSLAVTVDLLTGLNIEARKLLADSMPQEINGKSIEGLSIEARELLADSMPGDEGIERPRQMRSSMLREIEIVGDAAARAADKAKELPDKESNYDRVVLAADVARALKNHLGITPTSTTPKQEPKNAVPVYALVLEKTLAMAGERNCNWKALTVEGIALMHEMDGTEIGDE